MRAFHMDAASTRPFRADFTLGCAVGAASVHSSLRCSRSGKMYVNAQIFFVLSLTRIGYHGA